MIPLEELTAGTCIIHMRAVSHIELVLKFHLAAGAAHAVTTLSSCVPLLCIGNSIVGYFRKIVTLFFFINPMKKIRLNDYLVPFTMSFARCG